MRWRCRIFIRIYGTVSYWSSYFLMKITSALPLGFLSIFLLYFRKDVQLLFSALCDISLLGGKNADSYFKWESQPRTAKSVPRDRMNLISNNLHLAVKSVVHSLLEVMSCAIQFLHLTFSWCVILGRPYLAVLLNVLLH